MTKSTVTFKQISFWTYEGNLTEQQLQMLRSTDKMKVHQAILSLSSKKLQHEEYFELENLKTK